MKNASKNFYPVLTRMRIEVAPSTRPGKKLVARFFDAEDKVIKTTHFGDVRYKDFTSYSMDDPKVAKERRLAYIKRHRTAENWRDPMAAGTLSRYLLWEKPTLTTALKKYRVMFDLR